MNVDNITSYHDNSTLNIILSDTHLPIRVIRSGTIFLHCFIILLILTCFAVLLVLYLMKIQKITNKFQIIKYIVYYLSQYLLIPFLVVYLIVNGIILLISYYFCEEVHYVSYKGMYCQLKKTFTLKSDAELSAIDNDNSFKVKMKSCFFKVLNFLKCKKGDEEVVVVRVKSNNSQKHKKNSVKSEIKQLKSFNIKKQDNIIKMVSTNNTNVNKSNISKSNINNINQSNCNSLILEKKDEPQKEDSKIDNSVTPVKMNMVNRGPIDYLNENENSKKEEDKNKPIYLNPEEDNSNDHIGKNGNIKIGHFNEKENNNNDSEFDNSNNADNNNNKEIENKYPRPDLVKKSNKERIKEFLKNAIVDENKENPGYINFIKSIKNKIVEKKKNNN